MHVNLRLQEIKKSHLIIIVSRFWRLQRNCYCSCWFGMVPESLIMAAEAYENLELNEAARNVYKQIMIFYKSTKWEKQSEERLANLPPPA